ncbi:MAG: VCBS domain-containing protein, partial [Bacteroidales bacterium]|nr:VCBS domain-containing protein [Bacteroidales bacterium]
STFGTSYTYEAKSGTAGKSESVIFTVTDADGDQTSATATVTVIMPKSLDIKKKYGWYADEAALSGGNAYSEKGSNNIFLYDTNQEFIILEGGKGKYGEINDLISEWYYYLNKPYTDDTEGQDGRNLVLAADEVLVTTADADNPYLVILIPIKDDIPVISAEDASLSGQSTTGSLSFNYGADVPAASTLTVSNGTLLKTGAYAGWYEMTYGWVKLAEDGKSYTYQTISLTTETTETIIFTVTDADGDQASATAKVKIPAQTAEIGTNEGGGDPSDPVEIGGNTGGGVSGELSPVSVDVDEAALSGGNAYGGMGSTRAAVAVKGYDILEGGEGNYGNIAYDEASGEWMYSLTKSYQDTTEGQDGRNVVPAADNVTVTVRDGVQKKYSATVRINIRDDIPAISAGNVSISEELAVTGTLAINYGADVPDASTLVVSNGTRVESGEHAGWYETTCLWVKLGGDGKSYTYEAKPGTAGNKDTVTFAITDADGDQATATVTVTIGE